MEKKLLDEIKKAIKILDGVAINTPIQFCSRLSKKYQTNIYFKREDLQEVRSFKIRGAYNKIYQLSNVERKKGVVTASAGNHAQGVALSCAKLKIKGVIFMPKITPKQKIDRVKYFGDNYVEIKLEGDNYDQASNFAKEYAKKNGFVYIHAFDDEKVITGQATIANEIYNQFKDKIDYLICPIGGGGLISGIAFYLKQKNKKIKIIGVESIGTQSMNLSLKNKKIVPLETIDSFCDGIAVKKVGQLTYELTNKYVDQILVVDEGKIASVMIDLFQNEGIIIEPASATTIAVLDSIKKEIKHKNIVCVLSGGNFDLLRYSEILEKSLVYQGLKHYFLIEFAQKPGQLKKFVNNVLGPNDDIILFEYIKKNNKEKGPALVGIELIKKEDFKNIINNLKKYQFSFKVINSTDLLYKYLIL
ncbi:MAG: threonine ammonia-lyase IlvA [Candidatus Microgenomates bacterium]